MHAHQQERMYTRNRHAHPVDELVQRIGRQRQFLHFREQVVEHAAVHMLHMPAHQQCCYVSCHECAYWGGRDIVNYTIVKML